MTVPLTLFKMSGHGVAPFSARGLSQSLEPIGAAANNRRSINGASKDLSQAQFRKYRSTVTGSDQNPPAFDGEWPGLQVTVDCAATLSYRTSGNTAQRPLADRDSDEPPATRTEGAFTIYHPRLVMRIMNFQTNEDEYGAVVSWTLELEEV